MLVQSSTVELGKHGLLLQCKILQENKGNEKQNVFFVLNGTDSNIYIDFDRSQQE